MSRIDSVVGEQQPLVSVCIPVYNSEKTISETLHSILGQTYRNIEVIVLDNASTDSTLALLKEFDDVRLRIYRNEANIGAERNFSKAVYLGCGEYTALFHADDLYLPEMVEKQVAAFQRYPTTGAVFTLANYIDTRGEIIGESYLPPEFQSGELHAFPQVFQAILKNANFLTCPSAMVKSRLYRELMPFDVERFRTSADLDMWFRIMATHPIVLLKERLMSYRFSLEQASYQLAYQRTERADFYVVMDHYLAAQSHGYVSAAAVHKYELAKNIDRVRCAVNFILKDQPPEAKKLLKETFSVNAFWGYGGAIGNIPAFKVLTCWLFAVTLTLLLYLGLGRCLTIALRVLILGRGALTLRRGVL